MFTKILTKIFGSRNDRVLKKLKKFVNIINELESKFEKFSDDELKNKTSEFKKRIFSGVSLNKLLPEAFAVVREASKRVLGMRHFDVQLLGGIVLNNRCVAEMRTGEGKTLTSTLPAYLNALTGNGVHIVTVNDYLAKRDANNNKSLFEFLGMTVGLNLPGMNKMMKKNAYSADITYGNNNEYGFDYLRDNMVFSSEERVQRKLNYALIDEVDSILIDEARTPLIISGTVENSSHLYKQVNELIPYLIQQEKEDSDFFKGKGHFSVDEKSKQVNLTERGLKLIEKLLVKSNLMKNNESLYSHSNIILMHHVMVALKAHVLFVKNVDYIVKNNQIVIVDEHTGRTMEGRCWSDGLHQAIEAKERVNVQNENQTLASITFQNYFRLYKKLAGMTGSADTEAFELRSIYKLDTIVIPTNRPMIRNDLPDLVYITESDKINAIIDDIRDCSKKGKPVLVGTISIEKSELISNKLKKARIKHNVLNAKFHSMEADIISEAGQPGSVTIATNMAGRGTDIVLGGSWKSDIDKLSNPSNKEIEQIKKFWKKKHHSVVASGGLHIIGTERHESRRIDNQLRGRSGRQGDPGSSRFYLSMEDSLIRIFASEKIANIMRKLGMKPGEAIEHPWISKAIANAQRRVESRNFEIRKQLLEYDDVANDQRKAIYSQRNALLDGDNIFNTILNIRKDVLKFLVKYFVNFKNTKIISNFKNLQKVLLVDFNLNVSINNFLKKDLKILEKELYFFILNKYIESYKKKEKIIGFENMRNIEKSIMLHELDILWKEHLSAMDYLRQGIHLRGYAQKDPKQEYKMESFSMFSKMLRTLKYEVISLLSKLSVNDLKKIVLFNKESQNIINNQFKKKYFNENFKYD